MPKLADNPGQTGRLSLRHIIRSLKRVLRPDPIETFFSLPYEDRVREVQRLYSPELKQQQLGDWLSRSSELVEHELESNIRFFMDVIAGYALTLSPAAVMQWGTFTMTEGQCLSRAGYAGGFIASDFASDHLSYLSKNISGLRFKNTEFRKVDLEYANAKDFDGAAMAVALAVLSNIQPEGIQRLFGAVADSELECVVIGDTYVKDSLNPNPGSARSIPYTHCRNWCHPYLALAARYDMHAHFMPDFTYSSFLEARGIFVIHKGIPLELHATAMERATRFYLRRQPHIWSAYADFDLSKPQITTVHRNGKSKDVN